MIIGIPTEIKEHENRVSLTPAGVDEFKRSGHTIYIQKGAGEASGFPDSIYEKFGAEILETAEEVWAKAEMIIKVKEPLESEFDFFREDMIIFTYLHLSNKEALTNALAKAKTTAIAYETVELPSGFLPLLSPMSEIAGRMAIQQGALHLERINGGKGVLLDGVPGVAPAHVVIIGAGTVGSAAVKRAAGMGARVTLLDRNIHKLKHISEVYNDKVETVFANNYNITKAVESADLVVLAILVAGAQAPKIVTEKMVKNMEDGSVIIDVAIDQGGAVETITRPTTHENPTFIKHGVVHYAVANIPGGVSKTATLALTNVTFPYALTIADLGWKKAAQEDEAIAKGINLTGGYVTYEAVADTFDHIEYKDLNDLI